MQEAFGIVIFGVVGVGVVVAILTFATSGREYDKIGRGGMSINDDEGRPRAAPVPATSGAEREEEIRQFLEARNVRRVARGQEPLDVEAELAALTRPTADPGLAAEVRELVEASNRRRVRRGKAPLDVEAEVARQLRDLGEG